MKSTFRQALDIIREKAPNDTELGTVFENLVKIFLEHDAIQTQEYKKVWRYEDWAKGRKGYSQKDIGIDLVAELRDGSGFCAVQCKCYHADHSISKADLDSFISASSTPDFVRLLLVDTSTQSIGKNAQSVFDNLEIEYLRIQLVELEESRIDWLTFIREDRVQLSAKKELRDHQVQALANVREGLSEADRGKLIMACGTGKTFTSLRIAEDLAGKGKRVLYMVPSLSLMSQSVRDWKNDALKDFTAFSACSDIKVGKRKAKDDFVEVSLHDLAFPATTDAMKLSEQIKQADSEKMTVVFSTYHSIDVISRAQYNHQCPEFDLIICDEAHRTTGATLAGDDESNFVRIHDNQNVKGKKRLYMTATPRIFGETAKKKADEGEVSLASMDDEETYGEVLFHRGFGWAVENNLLTDYKVIVLAVDEGLVGERAQKSLNEGSELKLDDATKIVGCYKALAKIGLKSPAIDNNGDRQPPMRQALAFCQNIAASKMFAEEFSSVVTDYVSNERIDDKHKSELNVELQHVDGTFNAEQRNERLSWLEDETEENICRVLTNARCLSEGIDVPSLDAIMFVHPRKSQIDVVQSVGRVMRKAEGKDLGYVILPITVASGITPERALNDNERYRVVWQILNALRTHDERFDSTINRIGLGEDVSDRIEIVGVGSQEELEATTAVVEDVKPKPKPKEKVGAEGNIGEEDTDGGAGGDEQISFVLGDLSQAIKAKIVQKCGTRDYWENWATDIAKIAQTHIIRINAVLVDSGTPERAAFQSFLEEIRDDLNPEITESDAIEMLAQHLITKPVFDTLFVGNKFTSENAVSKAMEKVLDYLHETNIDTETRSLEKFYNSVKRRAADIVTSTGRQSLVLELYDRFFRNAFPLLTQRLGIVYTPVEIVDFILHSVNDALQNDFEKSLESKGIEILDPFTGTGTFITRLMQSGLITKETLQYKYANEIHANEIVLLAYYIAAINIESVYQDIIRENEYKAFNGVVLTDTFQLYEQDKDVIANLLPDNSERRTKQKKSRITVIVGNPPYSAGQSSANDNAANIRYKNLDRRIEETYAALSTSNLNKGLYDSYIRAFRWVSDRIGEEGIIGFVSGAGWLERSFSDGMRACLAEEFSTLYVLHLRGDIRKNMLSKGLAGEGENVFGAGSMTGIAISILVKNRSRSKNQIFFVDVGDNKSREEKLAFLRSYCSISKLEETGKFRLIEPDDDNDWINQGDRKFKSYVSINDSGKLSVFKTRAPAVSTNRDSWVYNSSETKLVQNVNRLIDHYNQLLSDKKSPADAFNSSSKEIKWTRSLKSDYAKSRKLGLDEGTVIDALYRPFFKQKLYFSSRLIEQKGITNTFIKKSGDRIIVLSGVGGRSGFSCQMTDLIPNLDLIEKGQCFPLRVYEKREATPDIFSPSYDGEDLVASDGISDDAFQYFQKSYRGEQFTKEDIFYYTYGLLHSPDYRERFKNNLSKELPRIPAVKVFQDFLSFSDAGRNLGDLHVSYESVEPYPVNFKQGDLRLSDTSDPKSFYRVEKMKFPKKTDKSVVFYNDNITMQGIPLEAYEYLVNGKPALQWVMERQCVKKDGKSGISNDANEYGNETMKNPAYPLELFQRVITVSLETMKIVRSLPKLDID